MKKLILLITIALISTWASAQTISYEYDNAGNRVKRKVITLKSAELATPEDELPITDIWSERVVMVYPNPTKGNLKISITGGDPEDNYSYKVFDSNGVQILNGQIDTLGEFPIMLQKYSSGVYILILQCNKESKTYKIIKQ